MATKQELLELQQTLYASKNPTRRWLHSIRRDWICDALARLSKGRNDNAMEVGPGSGVYLPVMAKLFKNVTASDVEDAYLDHAKVIAIDHPNLHVIADDIISPKIPEKTFDLILCSEVVEHIAQSEQAISGMRKLLKPSGTLILSTPQKYSPLELAAKIAFLPWIIDLVRMIYGEAIIKTGHINLMTEKEIMRQLTKSGFKIIEKHKSGFYIPLISEFTGNVGLKLEKWLESRLRNLPVLSGLLWTQYYIATI